MALINKVQYQLNGGTQLALEVCLSISVVCLALNLIVYFVLPELRNIPGKNLMSLSGTLIVTNIAYLVSFHATIDPKNVVCVAAAIVRHYAFLTVFTWMSVLALDVYYTFGSPNGKSCLREKYTFAKYCLYSYSTPAAIVSVAILIEFTSGENNGNVLRPMYGHVVCGISQCESIMVYFVIPVGIILFVNSVIFVMTSCRLKATTLQTELANYSSIRVRFGWYIKLSLLLGVTWIFSFVGSLIKSLGPLVDICMISIGLKGVFIFCAFTCKKSTYKLLVRKYRFVDKSSLNRYSSMSSGFRLSQKTSKV